MSSFFGLVVFISMRLIQGLFRILIGALGVGIGFGLQEIINNLVSGLIITFERPIQKGDVVKYGTMEGLVKEIGIRSSTIRTYDGSEVIVPNGKLISNELTNLTLSDPLVRIEIEIKAEYGTDPQNLIDLLINAANEHPDVVKSPTPFAIFLGYGEFAMQFKLYFRTQKIDSRLRIKSDVNLKLHKRISEEGINIPYPQSVMHIKDENQKLPVKSNKSKK